MGQYLKNLKLVLLLEELREAYELAKDAGHPELQTRLMQARRTLLDALHESLDVYGELTDLQEQMAALRAENEGLKTEAAGSRTLGNAILGSNVRKISS